MIPAGSSIGLLWLRLSSRPQCFGSGVEKPPPIPIFNCSHVNELVEDRLPAMDASNPKLCDISFFFEVVKCSIRF